MVPGVEEERVGGGVGWTLVIDNSNVNQIERRSASLTAEIRDTLSSESTCCFHFVLRLCAYCDDAESVDRQAINYHQLPQS
jgi:hypothetical protein